MSTNIKITRTCEFCKNEFTARKTKTRYYANSSDIDHLIPTHHLIKIHITATNHSLNPPNAK